MARPKKDEKKVYSEREIALSQMRNGRIDKTYLLQLVMEYKFKKQINKDFSMPKELAEVVLIIIDKMLGSNSWRGYTGDWKEEFRGRALEHIVKYAHRFDPYKCKSGKNDPYNYFAMMINNAFIQSWRKCKIYSENMVVMNDDVLYNPNNWSKDQDFDSSIQSFTPSVDSLDWGNFS
jgi:hypothetical protein